MSSTTRAACFDLQGRVTAERHPDSAKVCRTCRGLSLTGTATRIVVAFEMDANRVKISYEDFMASVESQNRTLDTPSLLSELLDDFNLPESFRKKLDDETTFTRGAKVLNPLLVSPHCPLNFTMLHLYVCIVRHHTACLRQCSGSRTISDVVPRCTRYGRPCRETRRRRTVAVP